MAYDGGSDPTLAELITAKFIPEMFSRDVLMHTKSNLVSGALFNTQFRDQLRKGSVINIPVFSEGSVTEVTPGTEPTAQDLASSSPASITIDKWYQIAAEISDLMEIEEEADYMKNAAESCSYSILKEIDRTIGAKFSGLSSSSTEGADGQTFTDEIFIALVETLDENDVPNDPRFLIGDASLRADMLGIDKFVRTDFVRETVPTGKIGMLYGAGVYLTQNLTAFSIGSYGVYSHRDAIGVVIQKAMRSRIYDMGFKFITKIIVDAAWGVEEIRENFGKSFYTRKKSP